MFKKNNIPWNKGIPRTSEEKLHIKQGQSDSGKKNISLSLKNRWKDGEFDNTINGPSQSKVARRKISEANRKRVVKDSTKEKIRQSRLGKPGVVVSEKRKKEYSERMKINNPMFCKEVLDKHPIFKSGPSFVSIGENKLMIIFDDLKLKYYHQKKIKKEKGYYVVDFYFSKFKKIIEFDGHSSHRMFPERDMQRDKYIFENYGYITLRIVSPELNLRNREQLLFTIKTFLNYEIETIKNTEQTID